MEFTKKDVETLLQQKSDAIKLIDKQGKSDVWKKFKAVEISGILVNQFVVCSICKHVFLYNSKTGLSNLKRHDKCQTASTSRNSQPSLQQTFLSRQISSNRKHQINEAAISFIATDLRPLSVLQGAGFKILAQELVDVGAQFGRVQIEDIFVDRKTLTENYLQKKYSEVKTKIFNEINLNLVNGISFTTDFWTDQMRNISYMSLTAHIVNKEFKLKSYFLAIKDFSEKKTATNICKELFEIIKLFFQFTDTEFNSWKIADNFCFVTDNGANIVAALKDCNRISCAAHNLNLSFELFLKNIKDENILKLINNSKEIVSYFKRSGLNNKLKFSLKQAVPTRWNSLLTMLKSINKSYDEVFDLLSGKRELSKFLDIDRNMLQILIEILTPLDSATAELSQDYNPTLHLVLPWFKKIINHLEPNYDIDSDAIINLKHILKEAIKSKYTIRSVHNSATFLDPRMKNLKMLSENEKSLVIDKVRQEISKIEILETDAKALSSECSSSKRIKLCEIEDFFDCSDDESISNSDEILKYINFPKVSPDICPLNFWHDNKTQFPKLSKLAQFLFSIPATSTSSERCFSLAGRTIEKRRSNLSPAHVEKLLFLKYNLHKQ